MAADDWSSRPSPHRVALESALNRKIRAGTVWMVTYKSLVSTGQSDFGIKIPLEQVIWKVGLKYLSVKWGCWEELGSTLSGSLGEGVWKRGSSL